MGNQKGEGNREVWHAKLEKLCVTFGVVMRISRWHNHFYALQSGDVRVLLQYLSHPSNLISSNFTLLLTSPRILHLRRHPANHNNVLRYDSKVVLASSSAFIRPLGASIA